MGGRELYKQTRGKKKKCIAHIFLEVASGSDKLHKVAPVPVVVTPKLSKVTGMKWQLRT